MCVFFLIIMVYIYKKIIGNNNYYYLRASIIKNNKKITKDIAYLGSDSKKIFEKLNLLPKKYSVEIRSAYRNINLFIETEYYLSKITKIKSDDYFSDKINKQIAAIKLHFDKNFSKRDKLTKQEQIDFFVIDFAYNTTSIEGNTITLKQAEQLLINNLTPKNKELREIYDLTNTKKTFAVLKDNLKQRLSQKLILKIHEKLVENIDVRVGYRTQDVRILRMNFKSTPYRYIKADMDILLNWYNRYKKILHPLVLVTLFHHKFEKIHPFADGNGRTGRMIMNFILIKLGFPPFIISKKNRLEYINNLNKVDKENLDSLDSKKYRNLISFVANEFINGYWDHFI
jgi:Fic family protein